VVIPVRNGGSELRRCLEGVASQRLDEEVEVVVIDSSSTDGSADLARSFGARVLEIAAPDFTHGGSRNLGAREARGDLLVFTSQDAYAEDATWLATLRRAFSGEEPVAGVYGRQLAHRGSSPPEEYFLEFLYGADGRDQRLVDDEAPSMRTTLFSNVNSAIPRSVWEQYPFVEDIIMSEDQEWSLRILRAGRTIRYVPEAAVRHSHQYTVASAMRRFFDSGVSAERTYLAGAQPSSRVLRREALAYARGEIEWLWRTDRRRWLPYSIVYESAKFVGLQLGAHHRYLPSWLKYRLSEHKAYWAAG